MDLFADVAELRKVLGAVDLSDEALETFEGDAEAAITGVAGPLGAVTHRCTGDSAVVMLPRRATSISAVREGFNPIMTLADDDWILRGDRRSIERLPFGTNPAWLGRLGAVRARAWFLDPVEVDYVPLDDTATRRTVAILLIRAAAVAQPGVLGMTEGNFSIQYTNGETYTVNRDEVLEVAGPLWSFG